MPFTRPRTILVPIIIAINIFVYLAWNAPALGLTEFLARNCLVSYAGLQEGRYFPLLGSVFSHEGLFHLLVNMFVLNSFGTLLELVLGRRAFLSFYLIAGVVASLSHCLVSNFILHAPELNALGASGAIAGLVVVFSFLFPKEKLLLFGFIPVPAFLGAFLVVGLDIWGLMAQVRGGGFPIGYGAHLGGAAAGLVYYLVALRGLRARLNAGTREA
ncbi:MAG: rhomboid family intramembrane serine protease [Proteobacteria bacterium]|nr:MAG: rhomboid family intramembrane serine protease [Pseudomonadota bacterium]